MIKEARNVGRVELANEIVMRVIAHREAGEQLPDAQVLAEHPDLEPELAAALKFNAGLDEGLRGCTQPLVPVNFVPLDDEELEAPIQVSDASAAGVCPQIEGMSIISMLGRGGQATVYKARQQSTGRHVAVKVLPGGPFALPHAQMRFDREAAILAALDHPGIVSIIDRGLTWDGSWFIAMPLIDGLELDNFLEWCRDLRTILDVFRKLALAVGDAHAQGVVHRDLKPSNIRIDRHGQPHVLDFGLARLLESGRSIADSPTMTVDRQVIGSLPSASPEQVRGDRELDARSDVYSIGLMLYAFLAGEPAIRPDACLPDYLRSVMRHRPTPPSKSRRCVAGVGRDLDALVLKCLAKAPAERYQTGRELAAAIADVQAGRRPAPNRHRWVMRTVLMSVSIMSVVAFYGSRPRPSDTLKSDAHVVPLPRRVDAVGLGLLRIPAGQAWAADRSGRNIIVGPFWMCETEVTRGQYARIMNLPKPLDSLQPVSCISASDAADFCTRLSVLDHCRCRLPTTYEWTYAARAGIPWAASSEQKLDSYAWTRSNSGGVTHPVGQKQPNAWGLFDVWGNVAELCSAADGSLVMSGGSYSSASRSRPIPFLSLARPADAGLRIVVNDDK